MVDDLFMNMNYELLLLISLISTELLRASSQMRMRSQATCLCRRGFSGAYDRMSRRCLWERRVLRRAPSRT